MPPFAHHPTPPIKRRSLLPPLACQKPSLLAVLLFIPLAVHAQNGFTALQQLFTGTIDDGCQAHRNAWLFDFWRSWAFEIV